MNKKRLLILVLILFNIFLIVPNSLAIEVWVDKGTYTIVRQINLGTDDAFAVEDYGFWKVYDLIPVKYTWGDMRIGLRFNNVTKANATATYRERIVEATLSFYSNSSMPLADSRVMATLYPIAEENPSTFSTYENFMSREIASSARRSMDFGDMTSEEGEWYNYTDLEHIIRMQVNGLNNNVVNTSIAFKIYSASGEPNRYFRTYEYDPNYSVKLYITIQKLSLVDSTEEGWFFDEYRGIDIWLEGGAIYEDFRNWTEHDRRNNLAVAGSNGTRIEWDNYGYERWNVDNVPMGYSGQFSKDLNITYTTFEARFQWYINDTDISGHRPDYFFIGINNTIPEDDFVFASHYFNSINNEYMVKLNAIAGEPWHMHEGTIGWGRLYYNGDIAYLYIWIQNYAPISWEEDYDSLTSYNITDDFTYSTVYAMQSDNEGVNYQGWSSGWMDRVQLFYDGVAQTGLYYAVTTDENGTTTQLSPKFTTPIQVKKWIDDYLFRTGEDDKLDLWGDTILALMGTVGLIMIPLSFWLFMSNVGTDFSNAFYLLMVFFIMGLAFIITWLWA